MLISPHCPSDGQYPPNSCIFFIISPLDPGLSQCTPPAASEVPFRYSSVSVCHLRQMTILKTTKSVYYHESPLQLCLILFDPPPPLLEEEDSRPLLSV